MAARYTRDVKPIRLTRHARNRMRWHGITEDLVAQALERPDWEEASVHGRTNRWKQIGERFLRVTCRESTDWLVVISAVFKRRRPRGWEPVKIEYDPEADALYIQIRQARPADNLDIEEGVTVDVDEQGHIVGVEILDASTRLSAADLSSITIEKLPLEPTVG